MFFAKAIKNKFWSKVNDEELDSVQMHRDIAYKEGKHPKHLLNIFVPHGATPDRLLPVLIFVHGGSWRRGDRNHRWFDTYNRFCIQVCSNLEFVVVNISYRLSPEVKHPAHMQDVLEAFKYVHDNIHHFLGDRNKVIVCGHSAGGHLVLMCTLYIVCRELFDFDFHFKFPNDFVKGCIPISGVYDINKLSTLNYFVSKFIVETAFDKHPVENNYDFASPIELVKKLKKKGIMLPPLLCLNAEKDWGLDQQTLEFIKVLGDEKRYRAKQYLDSGSTHLTIIAKYGKPDPLVIADIEYFVQEVLNEFVLINSNLVEPTINDPDAKEESSRQTTGSSSTTPVQIIGSNINENKISMQLEFI